MSLLFITYIKNIFQDVSDGCDSSPKEVTLVVCMVMMLLLLMHLMWVIVIFIYHFLHMYFHSFISKTLLLYCVSHVLYA